jgi:tripartite-type tricarboxylate transporter receptor subunit TctC
MTPGGHSIFGAMFKSLPFDTVESFDWISSVMTLPFFVVVPAGSDLKTLADLVAKAKAAPGTVTYGSAGPGSTHHLGVELLAREAGVKFNHIPFRGDGPVITALLGSTVAFALATPTSVIGNVKAGKLRALAVTTATRAPALPDVPTVNEALGLKDYDVRSWFGFAGPAKMPKPVLERLNAEVRKALAVPEVRTRIERIGGSPGATSSQELRDRVARELRVWTKIVNDAGIPKH